MVLEVHECSTLIAWIEGCLRLSISVHAAVICPPQFLKLLFKNPSCFYLLTFAILPTCVPVSLQSLFNFHMKVAHSAQQIHSGNAFFWQRWIQADVCMFYWWGFRYLNAHTWTIQQKYLTKRSYKETQCDIVDSIRLLSWTPPFKCLLCQKAHSLTLGELLTLT